MRPSDPAVLPPLHSAPQIIIDMCERDALRRLRSLASEASRSRSPASVFNPGDVALLGAPVLIFSESRRASLPAATPSPRWWGSRSTSSICWCSRPERRLSLRWAKTAASRANEFPRRCSGACQWRWSGDSTCCTFFFFPLFEPSAGWNCSAEEEGTHAHQKGWWNINEDCRQRLDFLFSPWFLHNFCR